MGGLKAGVAQVTGAGNLYGALLEYLPHQLTAAGHATPVSILVLGQTAGMKEVQMSCITKAAKSS